MRLTSRDLKLLTFLHEQGVADSQQLMNLCFPTPNALYKRLHFLSKAGYIESVKASEHVRDSKTRFELLYKKLNRRPHEVPNLRIFKLGHRLLDTNNAVELATVPFWSHQIGLGEIRTAIEPYIQKGGIFLSDFEIKTEWSKFSLGKDVSIPDLVYRVASKDLAFEFERFSKGELTYFEKLSFYQRSNYKRVLYIAETHQIFKTIIKSARRFPKIGVTEISNLSKVFTDMDGFQPISSFLEV